MKAGRSSIRFWNEAQYIKNQRTMNETSTKRLKSHHALALTGTPIENSLAELWSIFDFLMPGYLFDYRYFSHHFEKDIILGKHREKQEQLKNGTAVHSAKSEEGGAE